MLLLGPSEPQGWSSNNRAVDFYDLKGDVEALLGLTGQADRVTYRATDKAGFHPGQSAAALIGDAPIGYFGVLHPTLQKTLDFDQPVLMAEFDLEQLLAAAIPAFAPVSRFPAVRRDLAVIVDEKLPVSDLLTSARSAAGAYVTELTLFDVYQGKGIDPHRKSVALGLTFQDQSRTLDDEEVNKCVQQVVDSLRENHGAELRA